MRIKKYLMCLLALVAAFSGLAADNNSEIKIIPESVYSLIDTPVEIIDLKTKKTIESADLMTTVHTISGEYAQDEHRYILYVHVTLLQDLKAAAHKKGLFTDCCMASEADVLRLAIVHHLINKICVQKKQALTIIVCDYEKTTSVNVNETYLTLTYDANHLPKTLKPLSKNCAFVRNYDKRIGYEQVTRAAYDNNNQRIAETSSTVTYRPNQATSGYLSLLKVISAARKSGIGRKILQHTLAQMKKNKCKNVGLTICPFESQRRPEDLESLIKFYRKSTPEGFALEIIEKNSQSGSCSANAQWVIS